MGHSDFSTSIGAVTASQFGAGQSGLADRRPLVSKRDDEEHHRQPRDPYFDDSDQQEDGEQEKASDEPQEHELEPLSSSIRGPEQHVGLLLDIKL